MTILAQGFGAGFNGPLTLVAELPGRDREAALPAVRAAMSAVPGVVTVTRPRIAPSGTVAVIQAYPASAPQAAASTNLVSRLRHDVLPPLERRTGMRMLVGGFTAGQIDFSGVLSRKLLLFIGIVVLLSALLLLVIFRSLVIPVQAAVMNLLSIGGALGATVAVFQWGWFGRLSGVQPGPIEPWIPLTGRVITAAAAIMICVFLSFMLGNQRPIQEFGFGLAAAVFLDALVVRCVLLPSAIELLGELTWRLPRRLGARLPYINIEGTAARALLEPHTHEPDDTADSESAAAAA